MEKKPPIFVVNVFVCFATLGLFENHDTVVVFMANSFAYLLSNELDIS